MKRNHKQTERDQKETVIEDQKLSVKGRICRFFYQNSVKNSSIQIDFWYPDFFSKVSRKVSGIQMTILVSNHPHKVSRSGY